MSNHKPLITEDETSGAVDQNPQTSNKTGLHSDARKPKNTGPDSHQEHKAPVPGAFGNDETLDERHNDTFLSDQAPADKAHLKDR